MSAGRIGLKTPKLDEAQDLFEMANLYPRTTGLPVTVWVRPEGGARHEARVKVSTRPGDRMDLDETAIVALRPSPALLHGELPSKHLEPVLRWAALNEAALLDYWDGKIDTADLIGRLQRI